MKASPVGSVVQERRDWRMESAETMVECKTSSLRSRRAREEKEEEEGSGVEGAERGSSEGGVEGVVSRRDGGGGGGGGGGGNGGGSGSGGSEVVGGGGGGCGIVDFGKVGGVGLGRAVSLEGGVTREGVNGRGEGCGLGEFEGWGRKDGDGVWEACLRRRSIAARMFAARVSTLWRWSSRVWWEECMGSRGRRGREGGREWKGEVAKGEGVDSFPFVRVGAKIKVVFNIFGRGGGERYR